MILEKLLFLVPFHIQYIKYCFRTFTFNFQPPMSDARKRVIGEAFNKLDKSGDGFITIDDVRGVYDVKVDIMRKILLQFALVTTVLLVHRI